jgi:hypothetical protein
MTRSPPGPQQMSPPHNSGNSSYNSATWERTLRMNSSSNMVIAPPLGSAPPPSTLSSQQHHHKPVRASLSNLSAPQIPVTSTTAAVGTEAGHSKLSNNNPTTQPQEADSFWYSRPNKISTAKTLQLHRQLSAGSSSLHSGKYLKN